jgi:membrane protease YdiL (CAAX protease family)
VLIIITFATAITEEIFARGFILKRLYEEWGNSYSAAFFSSLLFLIIHIPILITNLKLSGNLLLLFFATDFILSLVNSFVFLERKSLVAPILIHALYNIAILFYL